MQFTIVQWPHFPRDAKSTAYADKFKEKLLVLSLRTGPYCEKCYTAAATGHLQ